MALSWEAKQALLDARARLEDQVRWIQNNYSKPTLKGYTQYCLVGALDYNYSCTWKVEVDEHLLWAISALSFLDRKNKPWKFLEHFNDDRDRAYEDIIRVLDYAIETA